MKFRLPNLKFKRNLTFIKTYKQKVLSFVDKHPLQSFFIVLGALLALIILSFLLSKTPETSPVSAQVKEVNIYHIGQAPRITVQAQIRKTGVIKINALTGGVINKIYKTEGDRITRGELLVAMSANYQGGNALTATRQIAAAQYKNFTDNLPLQKEIISKQRDIANKTDDNSDQLREINAKSISETQSSINLNNEILTTLEQNLTTLGVDPVANAAAILSAKQLKAQYMASNNQSNASLRSLQYTTPADKPQAQISDLTKELTLKQLDLQEKQLELSKEVSRLQLLVAQINESLYFPVAPFGGIVERVLVKEKESVTPGTPLMIISQSKEEDPITAIAYVSRDIAQRVSLMETSSLNFGTSKLDVFPSFVSTEAVQGTLYAIYYPIPDHLTHELTNDGYITVSLPVGYPNTSSALPYIPLDAVYQTSDKAYIYVVNDNKAQSRQIQLGQVFGSFVEVSSGLNAGDQVILSRNIIEGDQIASKE